MGAWNPRVHVRDGCDREHALDANDSSLLSLLLSCILARESRLESYADRTVVLPDIILIGQLQY